MQELSGSLETSRAVLWKRATTTASGGFTQPGSILRRVSQGKFSPLIGAISRKHSSKLKESLSISRSVRDFWPRSEARRPSSKWIINHEEKRAEAQAAGRRGLRLHRYTKRTSPISDGVFSNQKMIANETTVASLFFQKKVQTNQCRAVRKPGGARGFFGDFRDFRAVAFF